MRSHDGLEARLHALLHVYSALIQFVPHSSYGTETFPFVEDDGHCPPIRENPGIWPVEFRPITRICLIGIGKKEKHRRPTNVLCSL